MIVRSSSTPTRPATRNAAGIATRIDAPMWFGHGELDDVGRVGAEHHQLAVSHVDDAHDAEGDRQADRDQHQHRAEAQAEEQRLDCPNRSARQRSIVRHRVGGRLSDLGVGLGERRRPATCRAAPPACFALRRKPAGQRGDGRQTRVADSGPSSAASARPVSISVLTSRIRLDADALPAAARSPPRRATASSP